MQASKLSTRSASRRPHGRAFLPELLESRTLLSAWGTVVNYQLVTGMDTSSAGTACDAAGNVYAAGTANTSNGAYGVVLEKPNGSSTWNTVAQIGPSVTLNAIAVDQAGDVYAAGGKGTSTGPRNWAVYEKPAGGSSFAMVDSYPSSTPENVMGLAIDGSGNVFAIGQNSTTVTSGKGKSATSTTTYYWTVREQVGGAGAFKTVDNLAGQASPRGITAVASGPTSGVYIAGADSATNSWIVRKSGDGGATWSTVDSFQNGAYAASALGIGHDIAGNVFAVGSGGSSNGNQWLVRESSDGGASWSTIDDFQMVAGHASTAVAVGADLAGNVYVVGNGMDATNVNHMVIRTNAGGSWATVDDYQLVAGKLATAGRAGFTVDPSGNLYAAGQAQDSAGSYHLIVRSAAGPTGTINASATPAPASVFSSTLISEALKPRRHRRHR